MRIAQVTPVYPPYRGGMGRVAFEYTERLRARGYDVQVFTPRYGEPDDITPRDSDYVHRIPARLRVGNAGLLPSLPSDLAGFDVVHLHYPFYGGAEPVAHARASGQTRAVVLTYHMDASAEGVKGAVFDVHRETIQPWILSHADKVLVSSRDYAEHSALAEFSPALERTEVHPFGVDPTRFHPGSEPALRMGLNAGESVPIVVFVGSLDTAHDFKGLPVLLEAVSSLSFHEWRLVVVGDGSKRQPLEQRARELGISSQVRFVGDVTDEDLPRYYRLADLHTLPSTSPSEAFGLVTLEAAASGIPSVVSDLPGVRTTVIHGMTGFHVPARDPLVLAGAIQQLCRDRELRLALGQAARDRARTDFSWDSAVNRVEQTYRSVLPRNLSQSDRSSDRS